MEDSILEISRFGDKAPIRLDMSKIHLAVTRASEVVAITPQKAPELINCLLEGYFEARRHLALLKREYDRAKDNLDVIRSTILLDKVPSVLEKRGLKTSSADIRDAIICIDPDYINACNVSENIKCAVERMEGYVSSLDRWYFTADSILRFSYKYNNNSSLSHDMEGDFGKARY